MMAQEETYYCPLCQQVVQEHLRPIHETAEEWVISHIKETHPEWIESNGACPNCIQFFRSNL